MHVAPAFVEALRGVLEKVYGRRVACVYNNDFFECRSGDVLFIVNAAAPETFIDYTIKAPTGFIRCIGEPASLGGELECTGAGSVPPWAAAAALSAYTAVRAVVGTLAHGRGRVATEGMVARSLELMSRA